MFAAWSSSTAQPIQSWQQGQNFTSSPFSSNFLHGGKQHPRQSTSYYSETLRGSYQSSQALETLQYQDELSELMMGDGHGSELQAFPDSFAPEAVHNPFQWNGETLWCGGTVTPSLDGSTMTNSEYAMSSLDSNAPSPQEPTSPETQPWKFHPVEPQIRRDSMNDSVSYGLPSAYPQHSNYELPTQSSNIMEGCEDQKAGPNHVPDLLSPSRVNATPTLLSDGSRPAWSISMDFEVPSQHDADPSYHRIRWLTEGAKTQTSLRSEQDKLIVEGKRRNMSYKEIKDHYKIDGAVSTLRGRYRAAVKPKNQRVRKPEWKPKDLELLAFFVNQRLGQGKVRKLKNLQPVDYLYVPWKSVVQDIANNGGSYHFGPSAAKKRFVELVAADKACEEATNSNPSLAMLEMGPNRSPDPVLDEDHSSGNSSLPYALRSRSNQGTSSANDSQTTLQFFSFPMSNDNKNYRSTSQGCLSPRSNHELPYQQPRPNPPFMAVPNSAS
ncbi:hypothetical protein FKW77_008083 [Venturia effusa]|uniref:Myb-like domain-containing protein n=1 Tax=Venturia effusa TaxID=50376 RepID=A0A517L9Q3_9PEZI|nr:hypothetical protein FKW77_008083 [Venturia effusa]